MALLEETSHVQAKPANKAEISKLWKIAGILLLITLVEFVFAFTLPEHWKLMKISIFVGLTFVKAFYIVSEFMHLKHETKLLVWSIALPLIFVVWMVIALVYEGEAISSVR
ncbi:MAG: cytochrome C oxidase subunit IV family protein [Cyclobacteriaceae bacterium]|nr:cytochrome C oxidase subunit IV family protein [Cyclobacteriaceae bacterium]